VTSAHPAKGDRGDVGGDTSERDQDVPAVGQCLERAGGAGFPLRRAAACMITTPG